MPRWWPLRPLHAHAGKTALGPRSPARRSKIPWKTLGPSHRIRDGFRSRRRKSRSTFDDLGEIPVRTRVAKKQAKPSPAHPMMLAGIGAALMTLLAIAGVALFVAQPKDRIVAKPQPAASTTERAKEDAPPQPLRNENSTPPLLEKEITNSVGMKLVRIPAGKFSMGSPEGEGPDDERPEHEVEITRPFYLGVYEVTQKQFKAVMGYNPSYFSRNEEGKEGVTYLASRQPAGGKGGVGAKDNPTVPGGERLMERGEGVLREAVGDGKEKAKNRLYRLPTEAEWEYACRGGAGSKKPLPLRPNPLFRPKQTSTREQRRADMRGRLVQSKRVRTV